MSAYHLKVNKALREFADAFGRAYDEQQALFQYWHGLTNKQSVGDPPPILCDAESQTIA